MEHNSNLAHPMVEKRENRKHYYLEYPTDFCLLGYCDVRGAIDCSSSHNNVMKLNLILIRLRLSRRNPKGIKGGCPRVCRASDRPECKK